MVKEPLPGANPSFGSTRRGAESSPQRVCTMEGKENALAARRKEAEQALKQARAETKAEKRQIKDLAAASMSAASWTASIASALDGDGDGGGRFATAGSDVEQQLAARTVGLVSAGAFREKREALEAEEARKREREREDRLQRKQAKKAKREQQERRGLSFADDEAEE